MFLEEWLDRGYAGEMRYMERTKRRRSDVRQVLPSARSVIALATLYNTDRPYSTEQNDPNEATNRGATGATARCIEGII